MKEWKAVAIMSLVVNVVMVGMLLVALYFAKDIVETKNKEISNLNSKVTALSVVETVTTEEAQQSAGHSERDELTEDNQKEIQLESEIPNVKQVEVEKTEETPQKEQPKKQNNLAAYSDELFEEYREATYHFEGVTEDILYENYDNATIKDFYEEAYEDADVLLNKMYGVLKKELPSQSFTTLQAEQRKWLQNLNKSKEERLAMGGSSAGIDVASEMYYQTLQRCEHLLRQYFGITNF